jgi:hypothetical protein
MEGDNIYDSRITAHLKKVYFTLELIYKVNLKSSVFFAYQGFQAPETVLSGFPESLVLREFQRLNKSALRSSDLERLYGQGCSLRGKTEVKECAFPFLHTTQTYMGLIVRY